LPPTKNYLGSRAPHGYILATSWLHPGYILATFGYIWLLGYIWLHPGYVLATNWLRIGYVLAGLTDNADNSNTTSNSIERLRVAVECGGACSTASHIVLLWLVGCCTAAMAATNARLLRVALNGVACFVKRETQQPITTIRKTESTKATFEDLIGPAGVRV
jgi:hypothetical protein